MTSFDFVAISGFRYGQAPAEASNSLPCLLGVLFIWPLSEVYGFAP